MRTQKVEKKAYEFFFHDRTIPLLIFVGWRGSFNKTSSYNYNATHFIIAILLHRRYQFKRPYNVFLQVYIASYMASGNIQVGTADNIHVGTAVLSVG